MSFFNAILIFFILLVAITSKITINAGNNALKEIGSSESSYWVNQANVIKSDLLAQLWFAYGLYDENKPVSGTPVKDAQDYIKSFNQALEKYVAVTKFTPEEEAKYKKVKEIWTGISGESQKVFDEFQAAKLKKDDLSKQIASIGDKNLELNDTFSEILAKIRADIIGVYVFSVAKGKTQFIGLIIILLLAIGIGVLSLFFARKLSKEIQTVSTDIFSNAGKINTIGSTLKQSSKSLKQCIEDQSHSIHGTSAAINEITSMVNRTTENASELSGIAKVASEKAEEGQKTMQLLVAAMETIQESSAQLQNIGAIIGQIHSKTAVINDIVSKTELLSLNASIESARAGEHGKGFAVVAEEVGNLAKISGKSAQEIQALITSSQEQVTQILEITKDRVDQAKKVTSDAQKAFTMIADNISTLSSVMNQIIDASKEQEVGVRQISSAMMQIDKSTHAIQAESNLTSQNSDNLVTQSEKLNISSREIEELVNGRVSRTKT